MNKKLIQQRKSSKLSSGEKIVSQYLRAACIKFRREYWHPELINDRTGNPLFFDFYLPRLNLVIEVDGSHHFEAVKGQEWKLRDQQYRDAIKDSFCLENGIKILRLTYAELHPPLYKLSECLGTCIDTGRHIHKNTFKKAEKQVKQKKQPPPKKKGKVRLNQKRIDQLVKRKQGNRVKEKNDVWRSEIERKRNEGRLKYPADIRIYLAEKHKNNATPSETNR